MYNIASPKTTPRCSGLRACALLLALAAAATRPAWADALSTSAADPTPDEVSYFGERVYSLREWPPDSGYGIAYRKTFAPHFAASLAYLNDAHFPGHHRDGVAAEAWLPIPLPNQFTLSVGGGPFYYYDTVFARNNGGYADAHGWAWLASLDATFQPWKSGRWSHLFFEGRIDYTSPSKSIETTSFGLGMGYRGLSDSHATDGDVTDGSATKNEIVASYWKTVTNSYNSSAHTARAEAIDYRRQIWNELHVSVGFLNEGDTRLIRRNGITAEGWLEPSFDSGLWSIGAGFGFYTAIDKYRQAPGRHVSDVVSATLSIRPIENFDIRLLWHRIVTDYNRDADIILWGVGYRF